MNEPGTTKRFAISQLDLLGEVDRISSRLFYFNPNCNPDSLQIHYLILHVHYISESQVQHSNSLEI